MKATVADIGPLNVRTWNGTGALEAKRAHHLKILPAEWINEGRDGEEAHEWVRLAFFRGDHEEVASIELWAPNLAAMLDRYRADHYPEIRRALLEVIAEETGAMAAEDEQAAAA